MEAKKHVLVVDDDEDIRELVRYNLVRDGYEVKTAEDGEKALKIARAGRPDLVLLDLMMPGVDGLEVCRLLKAEPSLRGIPVVMVTARGEEADVVAGLEVGADDYVVKPFSPRILSARVKAVLRRESRKAPTGKGAIRRHGIILDPGRRSVETEEGPVSLTFSEFNILEFLARRPGWVFTRGQIVDAARGIDAAVTERSVDVHIQALRRKLGGFADAVETVRGVGYRFKE